MTAFMITQLRSRALAFTLLVAGCASSTHVLVGTARPPISADQVKLYTKPPAKYEEIAIIDASSKHSFSAGAQQKTDKAIERLKEEAAKLGANGVLLQGIRDEYRGSVGTSIGSANFSGNSAFGLGFGTSGAVFDKSAKGIGIYVEQE